MELDTRKQRILQVIVQDYVATAEPVGSQILVQRYSLGVKSATIRNEMAEMSERGYLRQPYTSAGRVPSDQGYRFYVNRLMHLPMINAEEATRMRSSVSSAASELDTVLRRTCQLLAAMTHLPALATPPDADDTELRHLFLSPAGLEKALLVLLFSTGRAENRLLTETPLSAMDAPLLANALNARLGGKSLPALCALNPDTEAVPVELTRCAPLWRRLIEEVVQTARSVREETPVYIEGTTAVLAHPEFQDVERLSQFLSTLQERTMLLELLGNALEEQREGRRTGNALAPHAQVTIGGELRHPDLSEYSVVTSAYFVGDRERGTIGVLGPTRMDYGRATVAVEFMARTVGDLLTRLSVAP